MTKLEIIEKTLISIKEIIRITTSEMYYQIGESSQISDKAKPILEDLQKDLSSIKKILKELELPTIIGNQIIGSYNFLDQAILAGEISDMNRLISVLNQALGELSEYKYENFIDLDIIKIDHIKLEIDKGLQRVGTDPQGAVTTARTVLESTLKYIASHKNIELGKKDDLSVMYKKVANKIGLAPTESTEDILKQVLGGCSGIVSGIGALRNQIGDAHGSEEAIKLGVEYARLSINVSGSISIFLLESLNR